jgi:hypothetical protein
MEGQDEEGRKKVNEQVYAPPEGWGKAEANLFRVIQLSGEEED